MSAFDGFGSTPFQQGIEDFMSTKYHVVALSGWK